MSLELSLEFIKINGKMYSSKKLLLILARAIDHRVGEDDYDAPDIPILKQNEAWTAFVIKLSIIFVNFITCGFIITNIIHHW